MRSIDLPLASSIHTIHRPIARLKKYEPPASLRTTDLRGKGKDVRVSFSDDEGLNESDEEDDDFETTPIDSGHLRGPSADTDAAAAATEHTSSEKMDHLAHLRRSMTRSASLATVRIKRRARLAEKLKEVYGLNEINEVIAGMFNRLLLCKVFNFLLRVALLAHPHRLYVYNILILSMH